MFQIPPIFIPCRSLVGIFPKDRQSARQGKLTFMKRDPDNVPTMKSTPVVIEARQLTKNFGDLTAVSGISFDVRPGECFGILGPNGAGKTSTIRMVYGLSPRSGGMLRVFGQDITNYPRSIKAKIGVCPQDNNLDPDITVI